ncbi:hypothetical protein ACOSQ3_014263 [Xanthoceras sorbifolium]
MSVWQIKFKAVLSALWKARSLLHYLLSQESRKILLQGAQKDGLYHLKMPLQNAHSIQFHDLFPSTNSAIFFSVLSCNHLGDSTIFSVSNQQSFALPNADTTACKSSLLCTYLGNKTNAVDDVSLHASLNKSYDMQSVSSSDMHTQLWHKKLGHHHFKVLHNVLKIIKPTTHIV